MREILFRGKRVDNGEWVEGHLIWCEDGRVRILPSHTDIFCYEMDESIIQTVAHRIIPETVGQYTGLTDKNGTKIFEGDIVRYEYIEGYVLRSVVKFGEYEQDGSGSEYPPIKCIGFYVEVINFDCLDNCFDYMKTQNVLQTASECEVIGNIHDNPELLGGDVNA